MFWINFRNGGKQSIWATWERHILTPRREAQVTDLSWTDCDCQGWTPATWTVETGDCTRKEGVRWSDKSSGSQGCLPWATTFYIECHYVLRSRRAPRIWFNPECPHSVLTTIEHGLKSKSRASSAQERGYKYTQVYAWKLVVSGIWQQLPNTVLN